MLIRMNPKGVLRGLPFVSFIYISLILDILSIIAIVVLRGWLPPVVPLLYGEASGANQLVTTLSLLIAPMVSIFVVIINTFLSLKISDIFLKKILTAGSFLFSLLITIAVIKIILLVGFF